LISFILKIDKTIKLWKVFEKQVNVVDRELSDDEEELVVPKILGREAVMTSTPRRTYANAHAYHVNSISLNSDGETFLSADDLRINLWNFGINSQSFSKLIRLGHAILLLSLLF
tara:strand:+ start:628 stop:969 length:342 start_codon:yes stop_codon:yes gene_type:complete